MGRNFSRGTAAAAAAAHMFWKIKLARSRGSVEKAGSSAIVHQLTALRPKAVNNSRVENVLHVVVHPDNYKPLKAIEEANAAVLDELKKEPSKFGGRLSEAMLYLSLLESGGLGLGAVMRLADDSAAASHLLKKFAGEYDTRNSLAELEIESKLQRIDELVKELGSGSSSGGDDGSGGGDSDDDTAA